MAYTLTPIFLSLFYVTLFCSIHIPVIISFSVDLIHRDSPESPLYNPSSTHYERLNDAFHRSISRASYFYEKTTNSADDIQSQILPSGGAYIMKLSIGTPPVPIFAIADTGSDLTWTQCKPCPDCFSQVAPLFDPKKSSTYAKVPCKSNICTSLPYWDCSSSTNTCTYKMTYGDYSFSLGDLASETFTVGSTSGKTISIRNMFFGCGHGNSGTFNETSTGIIGLGGGSISFVQQLGSFIGGKFSYCLPPLRSVKNVAGKINFGDSAVVSGLGVVSTPLIKNQTVFYYLTLESISVGNKILPYKSIAKSLDGIGNDQEGNIIIDSGTTLTLLPIEFTNKLEAELKRAIGKKPTMGAPSPFSLCYKVADKIKVPTVTVKFTGAELELSGDGVFFKISDDLVCLALVASDIAIYGSLAQMNYLVGYDLVKNNVSFKRTDCTKK